MRLTRANIQILIEGKGYEPVQIDGIPEGFSFKEPEIRIGNVSYQGQYIAFIPLSDDVRIAKDTPEELLTTFNQYNRNAK